MHVYGHVSWTDKPEITSSASGKDVYVSWNGPQGGDLYVGVSHDFGETWTQKKLSDDKRYYYAYDARVLGDGTVIFSESSIVYSGLTNVSGEVWHHAVISRDKGETWENVVVAKVPLGESCVAAGCYPDFYAGQTSVVGDAPGHLVFAYEGPTTDAGPQRAYVSTSTNAGRTWSDGVPLSATGENATEPRLASSGGGTFASGTCRPRGHDPDAWNVWYRSSLNGGTKWPSPVKINGSRGRTSSAFVRRAPVPDVPGVGVVLVCGLHVPDADVPAAPTRRGAAGSRSRRSRRAGPPPLHVRPVFVDVET